MSPKYAAALLLATIIITQALDRGRTRTPRTDGSGRGTRIVVCGACTIVLLALAWPVPAPPLLPAWAQWLGVGAIVAGLMFVGTAVDAPRARCLADIAIWSGAAAASSSVPVFGSVAVALAAACAVRFSTFSH